MREKNLKIRSSAKRPAGRPRSEVSRKAILNAAYSFLQSLPVSSISTVRIARKAGVSSATVYRWWRTKEELLLDAFLYKADHKLVLKREGAALERLKEYVLQIGRAFAGRTGFIVVKLLAAIQDNPKLRKEFVKRILTPRDFEVRSVVKEAIEMRQLPRGMKVGAFLDSIVGPLLARLLFRHERIDEEFVIAVFDAVVAGTIAQNRAIKGS